METLEHAQKKAQNFEDAIDQFADICESVDSKIEERFVTWPGVLEERERRAFSELSDCRAQNLKLVSTSEHYCSTLQKHVNEAITVFKTPKKNALTIVQLKGILNRINFMTKITLPDAQLPQYVRTHFERTEEMTGDLEMHAYVFIGKWRIKRDINSTREIKSVGGSGSMDVALNNPNAVAIHPISKEIYVADTDNNQIQVFSPKLDFLRKFRPSYDELRIHNPLPIARKSFISFFKRHPSQKISMNSEELQQTAMFFQPYHMCFSKNGSVLAVTDRAHNALVIFSPQGQTQHIFGGEGDSLGRFDSIYCVAYDSRNCLYVTDCMNARIQKFDPNHIVIKYLGQKTYCSQPTNPTGIVIDKDDSIFVSHKNSDILLVYNTEGQIIKDIVVEYASTSILGLWSDEILIHKDNWSKATFLTKDGAMKKRLLLERPGGVVFNEKHEMIVTESSVGKVVMFSIDWNADSIEFPSKVGVSSNTSQQFLTPTAFCIHPITEEIYVADAYRPYILVYSHNLVYVKRILLKHVSEYGLRFHGVSISSDGTILAIADFGHNKIILHDLTADKTRVVGQVGTGPSHFDGLISVVFDNQDFFYTTEVKNKRIQKFTKNGEFVGFVGNTDGKPFRNPPYGITVNDANELVVSYYQAPIVSVFSTMSLTLISEFRIETNGETSLSRGPNNGFVLCHRCGVNTRDSGRIFICSNGGTVLKSFEVKSPCGAAFNRHGRLVVLSQITKNLSEY